jgi:expansin (peptidoglycan-binding protein)
MRLVPTAILGTAMAVLLAGGCGGGGGGGDAGVGGGDGGAPGGDAATADGPAVSSDGARPDAAGGGDGGLAGDDACVADDQDHVGDATYYTFADGTGNCSFAASPQDLMIGAMNHVDYAASAVCGACVQLTGPNATITIRIVDQCPECAVGDIDLSPEAFARIAELAAGRVSIAWRYRSCPVSGPIVYHFKEGSNQWWTAVQIRNHANRIATVEHRGSDGQYHLVPRLDYNYFVATSGLGPGPYDFRVTDVYGHVLEDSAIPFVEAGDSPGAGQFPTCGQ